MATFTNKQKAIIDRLTPMVPTAPWVLRITESCKCTGPVLVISERYREDGGKTKLREYGRMYYGTVKICREAIRYMLSQCVDDIGQPMGLECIFDYNLAYRGNLPVDKTIGAKLALLFVLVSATRNAARAELIAWRIERFSYEEAMYWLSKVAIPTYGERAMAWAKSGLCLMLAGESEEKEEIERLLDKLRK